MAPPTQGEQLLQRIRAFMREHPHMKPKTIGRLACNNGELVTRLELGLNPAPVTVERVETFIAGYRP